MTGFLAGIVLCLGFMLLLPDMQAGLAWAYGLGASAYAWATTPKPVAVRAADQPADALSTAFTLYRHGVRLQDYDTAAAGMRILVKAMPPKPVVAPATEKQS